MEPDMTTALELFASSNERGYRAPAERVVAAGAFGRLCLLNGEAALGLRELERSLVNVTLTSEWLAAMEELCNKLRTDAAKAP
jgi:hypothetical protein